MMMIKRNPMGTFMRQGGNVLGSSWFLVGLPSTCSEPKEPVWAHKGGEQKHTGTRGGLKDPLSISFKPGRACLWGKASPVCQDSLRKEAGWLTEAPFVSQSCLARFFSPQIGERSHLIASQKPPLGNSCLPMISDSQRGQMS